MAYVGEVVKKGETEDLFASSVEIYLEKHRDKSLLRFITCGSVDDGKSTLIGRLLYDSKSVSDDQLDSLYADSKKLGHQSGEVDFSLLVDGLTAEREQGITIDVAYRFFTTVKRNFIVADTPGHEQYTRNMATGASTADLAIILVDATKGVLNQTKRHTYLAHLMGVRRIVLAVNKMDLVDYDQKIFDAIVCDYADFANRLEIKDFAAIPVCGLNGDNIANKSPYMNWYCGDTLLQYLENVEIEEQKPQNTPFRMPVQLVIRKSQEFRGYAGQIIGGKVRYGDRVKILPSGKITRVKQIVTYDGDLPHAVCGQSVTLCFDDEVDCSRGDLISVVDNAPQIADQFDANFIWLNESAMVVGRAYWLKIGTQIVSARIMPPKYVVNVNNMDHLAAKTFELNSIGVAQFSTDKPIIFEPYVDNRTMGGFILIDKVTNSTIAAGMINFALRRAQNIYWQSTEIGINERAIIKHQKPKIIWLTGLSGSGKSTIANLVEKKLYSLSHHTFLLDGDNVRHGLNKDLGFTEADRIENIRRIGEVSKLMYEAGLLVIAAFISPYFSDRQIVRNLVPDGDFIEVFVDAPLEVAEKRDPKGLYKLARQGVLKNFTGVDSEYDRPENPDLIIDTTVLSAEAAADMIVAFVLMK